MTTFLPKNTNINTGSVSRKQISFSEKGLRSVEGARTIIEAIRARAQVTKLALSHNHLGDEGCIELFSFLSSPEGKKYQITDINLTHNHLGDQSLVAISNYLKHNTSLTELWLQSNSFSGDEGCITTFIAAVNVSQLRTLTFSSNCGDGDALISHLLDTLDSPSLTEIQISMADLTYASVPHIANFVSSPRCRLHAIHANGNRLGLRGIREIVQAVERHNYCLTKVDLFANWDSDTEDEGSDADSSVDGSGAGDGTTLEGSDAESEADRMRDAFRSLFDRLTAALKRNTALQRETAKGAFALLRYGRAVLLNTDGPSRTPRPSSAPRLPIELQLHILSFLAPTLSTQQILRIYHFAETSITLPRLSTPITDSGCIPDPSSLSPAGPAAFGGFNLAAVQRASHSGCESGKCMGSGSLMCRREVERSKWLAQMGCHFYEPEP